MTDREKAIVMAYTGISMLVADKFSIFHEYIEKICGRPIWTHELAEKEVWNEIKEKSKPDFIALCRDTTEAEPIMRCKDCKNYKLFTEAYVGQAYCEEYGGFITENDYCSRGARIDGKDKL